MTTTALRISPAPAHRDELEEITALLADRLRTLRCWAAQGERIRPEDLGVALHLLDAIKSMTCETIEAYRQETPHGQHLQ